MFCIYLQSIVPPFGLASREQLGSLPQERPERVHNINNDALVGVGGDVRSAFGVSTNVNMSKIFLWGKWYFA